MSQTSESFRELGEAHRARAARAAIPTRGWSHQRIADSFERLAAEAERLEQDDEFDSRPYALSHIILRTLAKRLETPLALAERIEAILDAAISLHSADFGNVQLLDVTSSTLKIVAQRNFGNPFLAAFAAVDAHDASACGHAFRAGAAVIVEDVRAEPTLQPYRAVFDAAGVHAVQSTPIVAASGAIVGMLSTHFAAVHRPTALEMAGAEVCAGYISESLAGLRFQPPTGRVAT